MLGRKRTYLWLAGLIVLVVTGLGLNATRHSAQPQVCSLSMADCAKLEVADSADERERGLSFRDELPAGQGLLFVFESPEPACIWMKDMNFDIDIIWVNADLKISKVETQVSPATYPQSFCAPDTAYVIELAAGRAEQLDLTLDRQLDL